MFHTLRRLRGGARKAPQAAIEQKARPLDEVLAMLDGGVTGNESGVVVSEMTALRVSVAQACVALVANDVAALPMRVMRRARSGEMEPHDGRDGDVLTRAPNEWQTQFEFRQMMTAQAMLRGEAFALKVPGAGGRVRELWPLQKSEVGVSRVRGDIVYTVSAYEGRIAGQFARNEILHLRGFTWDGYRGLDRMHSAGEALGLARAAELAQARSFSNGTRTPGFWSTDQALAEEAVERLAEQLRAATTGGNQFRSPVVDNGVKWQTVAQNFRDAEMVETRKHQAIEVCAAFNVLPAVLGIDDKTQAFASVEAMMRAHLQHTLRPWLVRWEQVIDKDVLDGAAGPLVAKFDTADMEKASTRERAEAYRTLVELGIMTRNEARQAEGLKRLDGLDEPLTPMNMGAGDASQ